uniref:Vomeronasal type-1 receptor n=1 Tax=Mus musculus domesticus TaxID=10092 RepID=F6MB03_MOUSE|nr:vomeronasal type 1 receptor D6 [Mus musculus domesticus]AEF00118.1 vomeronasal type 1 receptor D6 [Mus musculus domesticus]
MVITPLCNEAISTLSQNKIMRTTEEVALQILLLCQVGVGILGNILLFLHNFSPILTDSQLRPIQIIQTNLAVANTFILLFLTFPNHMAVLAPRKPPTDLKCKLAYFFHMVARSTNMCSTCVLSTYQFVTLVPGTWARVIFREISPKVVSYSCYSCWLFSVLNNAYIPMNVSGPQKTDNGTDSKGKWVCSTSGFNVGMSFLQFAQDIIFISTMIWTSVSIVLHLNRHHQRMHYIHNTSQKFRAYAETRAAHTVLMLVVTFVSFYLLDCICTFFHISFVNTRFWLRHVKEVLTVSFPTISPLLLIFRDPMCPCPVPFIVGLQSRVTGISSLEQE